MRTYTEVAAGARPGPAFSNGSQWMDREDRWCAICVHYGDPDDPDFDGGCPLVQVALIERTVPAEWTADSPDAEVFADYHCIEFRDEDDGPGPEPQPIPDPPDQEVLLPREACEGTRMLTTIPSREAVSL